MVGGFFMFLPQTKFLGWRLSAGTEVILTPSMENELVERAAGALADKYRLAVILALSREDSLPFAKVQELMGLSQPCVSHHLKVLADSGLITTQKTGRCVQVQLNKGAMQDLASFLGKLG
jgi:ArsR family transcriptional regulator